MVKWSIYKSRVGIMVATHMKKKQLPRFQFAGPIVRMTDYNETFFLNNNTSIFYMHHVNLSMIMFVSLLY